VVHRERRGRRSADNQDLLTIRETADRLRVSIATVRRLIRSKSLPAYRVGHSGPYRIRNSDIDELLVPVDDLDEDVDLDDFIDNQIGGRS